MHDFPPLPAACRFRATITIPIKTLLRDDAALLYSGVVAARSTGDGLDSSLKLRTAIADGSKLGAELFICGPMFTAEGGHGTEYTEYVPAMMRDQLTAQLVRIPKTADEAHEQVRALTARGVDAVKASLESGSGQGMLYTRMDIALFRAVADEARAQNLPLAVHTGDSRDVSDAVEAGASSVEHGSWRDKIPDAVLAKMAHDGIDLDPTLGVGESYTEYFNGNAGVLDNSLVQQTLTATLLKGTRDFLDVGQRSRRGQGGHLRQSAGAEPRLSAACLEGRRAPGDGHRFRQSTGLSRSVDASRIASVGEGRNSRRGGLAGCYRQWRGAVARQEYRNHSQRHGGHAAAGGRKSDHRHQRHGANLAGGFQGRTAAAARSVRSGK